MIFIRFMNRCTCHWKNSPHGYKAKLSARALAVRKEKTVKTVNASELEFASKNGFPMSNLECALEREEVTENNYRAELS